MAQAGDNKPKPRRKKRRGKVSEPERIIRAVQAVAGAAVIAYKVIKPHLSKLRKKGRLTR